MAINGWFYVWHTFYKRNKLKIINAQLRLHNVKLNRFSSTRAIRPTDRPPHVNSQTDTHTRSLTANAKIMEMSLVINDIKLTAVFKYGECVCVCVCALCHDDIMFSRTNYIILMFILILWC